jgi:hypothetical protein
VRVPLRCVSALAILPLLYCNAYAQGSNPFFVPPTYPGTGQAVTADFNHDGKPDLIFADGTVLLGNGDGTFTVGTPLGVPGLNAATLIATADFNGDGKPDLVINGALNTFSVLLGNGDGTFQPPIVTSVATPVASLAVGDLNGDGKPDVLATTGSPGALFSFLGKGDGTFSAGIMSGGIAAGTLADFNGDGKLDLLQGTDTGVQLGHGDGTFGPLLAFPAGFAGGLVGDFNGDGKLDVLGSNLNVAGSLQVVFGNGDGTFTAGPVEGNPATVPGCCTAANMTNDGKTDLIVAGRTAAQVLKSNGDGTFTAGTPYNLANQFNESGGGSISVVIADFNGDGKTDVAAFNTLLLGNGDATLQGDEVIPGLTGSIVTADFNKDGHPDLALVVPGNGGPTANLQIFLNDGKAGFTLAHSYQIPTGNFIGFALAAAVDVNGDGNIDLVGYTTSEHMSGNVGVLLGNGDGSFGAPTYFPGVAGAFVYGFTLADLNGDGKPDIMIVTTGGENLGNTFTVLLNNGDGTFGPPATYFAADVNGNVVAADFNKDGKIDAAVGTDTHGIALLLGKGDGTFQPATFITNSVFTGTVPQLAATDFNGDGNIDLIASGPVLLPSNGVQQTYQVLLGKGDATFTALPAVTNTFVDAVQVADLNGDGKLDLLGLSGSVPALVLGNGDGTFGSPFLLEPPGGTPLIADFNGDGQPDIAISTSAGLVLLLNSTVPGFQIAASALSAGTITAGSSTSATITLTPVGGFGGAVALTCSGLPAGASCGFAPASVANASGTSALTITTTAATPASTYTVNVIGTSGSVTHQVPLTVTVTAPVAPDFSMTAGSGGTATVAPGQTATYTLSLAPSGGFGGSVTLTCSGAPAMAGCSISPATVTLSGTTATTATVTVTTTAASQVFLPGGTDAFRRIGGPPMMLAAWLVTALALFSLYRARGNQRIRWAPAVAMALLVFAGLGLASCGGGSSSGGGGGSGGTGTEAGTYTITVSATAAAGATTLTHAAKLTLVVQ